MKKYLKLLIVILSFFFLLNPLSALAKEKIQIDLYYGSTCPHCKDEIIFLKELDEKYPGSLSINKYEVWENQINSQKFAEVLESFQISQRAVPLTVIEDEYFVGYSRAVGIRIENSIQKKLDIKIEESPEEKLEKETYDLPLIGKVNISEVSIITAAIVLGAVDGFNPCAMWVLLFIINMLIGMKNKKKMFLLGYSFLFTSAAVYFFAMLGISFILSFAVLGKIRTTIGLIAVVLGLFNLYKYFKAKDDSGCEVVDDKKRTSISKRLGNIKNSSSLVGALLGIIVLAIAVNLIELTCSLGFPTIFAEILAINNIVGAKRILYLLVYVFMYMIDDLIVFSLAVLTFEVSVSSTKYGKIVKLVGGALMIIMGLLLIFKPEWVMLNF